VAWYDIRVSERVVIGLDVGGTKIEGVVARVRAGELEVLDRERISTLREEGYAAVLGRVAGLTTKLVARAGASVVSVGVGMPGGVERRTGNVKNSNTTCLNGRPFRADLERAVGASITFENDANCFALAEARGGAAREHAEGVVFGAILGTGVGGGVVIGGRIWSGLQGLAGEWGHHAVFAGAPDARACYCGQRGCLEAYLSGPAVERDYEARSGRRLRLAEIASLRQTDVHAAGALDAMLDAFARGVANVIDVLDPSAIVLGGGVSNLDVFYEEGRDRVGARVFNDELRTPIVKHALGDAAGVLGAAWLAWATPTE